MSRVATPFVEVLTAASNRRLVTLDDVKTELGITGTAEDAQLELLIQDVSIRLSGPRGWGRPLWRQQYREHLPGIGGVYLPMVMYPVERSGIQAWRDEVAATNLIDAADYSVVALPAVLDLPDRLYRETGWALDADDLVEGYIVEHWAGFDLPGESGNEFALPEVIQRAALLGVVSGWRNRDVVEAFKSASFEGISVSFRERDEISGYVPEAAYQAVRALR